MMGANEDIIKSDGDRARDLWINTADHQSIRAVLKA
jgi:hypothetical protein